MFLRSSSLLREDQAGWGQVMLTIMEASVAANRWFLYLCFADSKGLSAQTWGADLRLDDEMLDNYLVWCDYVRPWLSRNASENTLSRNENLASLARGQGVHVWTMTGWPISHPR